MLVPSIKWSYVLIGIVLLLVLWIIAGYNGLVSAGVNVETQWSQVETQYQRRIDLVPNLVRTVQGAARFERETLEGVTEARTRWLDAPTRAQRIAAAGQFESAIARLLVTVEAYPQLQAVQAFRDLLAQLEGTENRISVARRDYNEAVQSYNLRVKRFPSSVLATFFGFGEETFFEAAAGADVAPSVQFE